MNILNSIKTLVVTLFLVGQTVNAEPAQQQQQQPEVYLSEEFVNSLSDDQLFYLEEKLFIKLITENPDIEDTEPSNADTDEEEGWEDFDMDEYEVIEASNSIYPTVTEPAQK